MSGVLVLTYIAVGIPATVILIVLNASTAIAIWTLALVCRLILLIGVQYRLRNWKRETVTV